MKASDLIGEGATGAVQTVRSTVDIDKTIYACKIFETESFGEEELQQVFKEVKIHSMVTSDYAIKHH